MRRWRLAPLIFATLLPLTVIRTAAAASVSVTNSSLGAGKGSVTACDTDGTPVSYVGVTYSNTNARYEVTSVTVTNINAACNGGTIFVTLADSSGNSVGSGSASVSSTSATVSITATGASSSVSRIGVAVVGP